MDRVIWTDADYMGRGIKDPENDHEYNTTEYHTVFSENKRECPCDTCPLFDQCAKGY